MILYVFATTNLFYYIGARLYFCLYPSILCLRSLVLCSKFWRLQLNVFSSSEVTRVFCITCNIIIHDFKRKCTQQHKKLPYPVYVIPTIVFQLDELKQIVNRQHHNNYIFSLFLLCNVRNTINHRLGILFFQCPVIRALSTRVVSGSELPLWPPEASRRPTLRPQWTSSTDPSS